LLALTAMLVVTCGCGGGSKNNPVTGKVTSGGTPLKNGGVRFVPDGATKLPGEPAGEIKEDGTYTLTYQGKPGAPAGTYKVVVNSSEPSNPKDPYSVPKSSINSKYNTAESTTLSVTVPSGNYDLKLDP